MPALQKKRKKKLRKLQKHKGCVRKGRIMKVKLINKITNKITNSRITPIIVLLLGLVSIGLGMLRNEHLDVLQKATKI